MTYLDAAIAVLKAARRPLTVQDVTAAALRNGFIKPRGATPAATMSATLYVHAREAEKPLVEREYQAGIGRAARNSVKWRYIGNSR